MPNKTENTVSISTGTIFRVIIIIAALGFLYYIRDIVAVILVAVLLAALIDPFADWLSKRKVPRSLSVIFIYLILFVLFGFVIVLIVPPLVEQVTQITSNFSVYYDQLVQSFNQLHSLSIVEGIPAYLQDSVKSLESGVSGALRGVFATITGIFGGVVALIIVLVLSFYMVVEEEAAKKFFKNVAPAQYQPYLSQLMARMHKKLGAWLRGQLLVCLFVGLASYVGLTILGVKYALVLAIIAALFELIPYAGPVLSAIPAVFLAFAESPIKGVMVLTLYVIIQQTENNIIVPKVMQKMAGINPIISIVALLIGIKVAGVMGALLAIPVAIMISVFVQSLFEKKNK